jgi:hypothetical protein
MTIIFTIIDVDGKRAGWKLRHNPAWEIPFTTIEGTPHVWNWNFADGSLLQDGVPLRGYTIGIEREDAEVQPA